VIITLFKEYYRGNKMVCTECEIDEEEYSLEQLREEQDGAFNCWLDELSKIELIKIIGKDKLKEIWNTEFN
jgi:hypothetical protein